MYNFFVFYWVFLCRGSWSGIKLNRGFSNFKGLQQSFKCCRWMVLVDREGEGVFISDGERMEGSYRGGEQGVEGRGVSCLGGWEIRVMWIGQGIGISVCCLFSGRSMGEKFRFLQFFAIIWGKRRNGRGNVQFRLVLFSVEVSGLRV